MPYIIVHIPSLNAAAMALFPFILVKHKHYAKDKYLINHELIHFRQQVELLIIPFYVLYLLSFFYYWIKHKDAYQAYMSICFEREAYAQEDNLNYLKHRPLWAFRKYFF